MCGYAPRKKKRKAYMSSSDTAALKPRGENTSITKQMEVCMLGARGRALRMRMPRFTTPAIETMSSPHAFTNPLSLVNGIGGGG